MYGCMVPASDQDLARWEREGRTDILEKAKVITDPRTGRIIAAVPVAHVEAFNLVNNEVDELVSLYVSRSFSFAIASFYESFPDLKDSEIIEMLSKARENPR